MTDKVTLQTVLSLITRINPASGDLASLVEAIEVRNELARLQADPALMDENARGYLTKFQL